MTNGPQGYTGIYAIYDNQAREYVGGLLLYRHDAAAIRSFGDIARDPQTMIARHTADYELHKLGMFDPSTGHLTVGIEGDGKSTILTGEDWLTINRPPTDTPT